MSEARLITIPFSHFCEKARWGLEHAQIAYREQAHLPVFHWRVLGRLGAGRTVPVLQIDGRILTDSTEILRFCDERAPPDRKLYSAPFASEIAALEDELDETLGPHARRLVYFHTLPDRQLILAISRPNVPRWQWLGLAAAFPVARAYLRRGLRIDAAGAARSLDKINHVLDRIDARLADGRRFLVGDTFSAADLTFAALAALLVHPSEHPRPLPANRVPPALASLREAITARPCGAFALRMYREHRPRD